jgi:sporulation protein YlmC with PRC-barrel domain
MKLSELKGRAVIDISDSRKLGEFSDILIDATTRKPTAIKVKTGLFSHPHIVPIEQLKSVGSDAITVAAQVADTPSPAPAQPEGQTDPNTHPGGQTDPLPPLKEPLPATGIQGHKVITDTGTLVGEVQDIIIDPTTLAITGYEVRGGGLFARPKEIEITPEVRHGNDLITVPSSLLS